MRPLGLNRRAWAWAFYDWGNSAYATVVLAGFFPIFFRDYWSAGQPSEQITFNLGLANSASSLAIVLLAPILGAIADRGGLKKRLLAFFAVLGITMTAGLYWVAQGDWAIALGLFAVAGLGFMGANVFYDALMVSVAPPEKYDVTSALGFALGYLGGGLLFASCVAMTLWPEAFGLADAAQAVRLSFLLVAVWWAVFSLPVLILVPEPAGPRPGIGKAIGSGLRQLVDTFHHLRRLRVVALFLLAYWLYIDGVDTVVRMAVDYGRALGFGAEGLIVALLITQFVGFPAAIVFGKIGERYGAKRGIFIALAVYVFVTLWAARMQAQWEFFAMAIAIGLVQGGVQSLSRAYYARIIPVDKAGEFFGFYNMLGKFAAIFGPFLVGWVGAMTGSPRIGILSLLLFFIPGALLLYFVDERAGAREAEALRGSDSESEKR